MDGVSGTAGFAGAGDVPTGLVAVDADLESFIDSVMALYVDPTHFDTQVSVGSWVLHGATDIVANYWSLWSDCRATWGDCATWDGTLAQYYGSVAACVAATVARGIVVVDNLGNSISRAVACGYWGRAFKSFTV